MASAYPIRVKQRDGRTTWSVRLHLPSGEKKTWKVSDYKPTTKTTAGKLCVLIDARRAGEAPPAHVAKWIDGLPDAWRRRLAEYRLLDPIREAGHSAIAEHLDAWEADVKATQRARGRDDRRARDLRQRVETVVEGAGRELWPRDGSADRTSIVTQVANGVRFVRRSWPSGASRSRKCLPDF